MTADDQAAPTWRDAERLIYQEILNHPGIDAQGLADHIADMLLARDLLAVPAESSPAVAVPAETRDDDLAEAERFMRDMVASKAVFLGQDRTRTLLAEYDRRGTELAEAQRAKVSWSRSLRGQEIRVQQLM